MEIETSAVAGLKQERSSLLYREEHGSNEREPIASK
jgi:hypothetical protein